MKLNLCMGCMRERKEEKGFCPYCGFNSDTYIPSAHHLPPGVVLNGKYLVGKALGEGGFGITYIGIDLNLELKVAIKEYYPSGLATRVTGNSRNHSLTALSGDKAQFYRKGMERFLDEARRLAKFWSLPGVVSVKDFFQENGTAYLVMEFVEGKSLKELLKESGGKLPVNQVLEMMRPVMESLEKVHAAGLIHRDISPDNLMVTTEGRVKLIDFGAARNYAVEGEKSLSVLLKPGYAPEEQYRSRGVQGPWTDVYALCATLYRCITGVIPEESLDRMVEDHLRRPAEYGVAIKTSQAQAIMKGLSVFGKDRYQSVRELMEALYSNDDTKEQEEQKNQEQKKKHLRLPKILSAGSAIAAVLLILFLLIVGFNNIKNKEKHSETTTEAEVEIAEAVSETTTETVSETTEAAVEETSEIAEPVPEMDTEETSAATTEIISTETTESETIIEWKDKGMKQYICVALNCSEEDITEETLTKIKVLRIAGSRVITLNDVAEDSRKLLWEEGIEDNEQLENVEIKSLQDLRWMPNLEVLQIRGKSIEDISALSELGKLTELDLTKTEITDISVLSELKNLTILDLTGTEIEDINALNKLSNLKELSLRGTKITDIDALSDLKNLMTLDMASTEIEDISALSELSNLNNLSLRDTKITDISALESLTNLTELTLKGTGVVDTSILYTLPNLKKIDGETFSAQTVIEWADAGMELCIRVALNRLEGDITNKELMDMKILRILFDYDEKWGKIVLLEDEIEDPGNLYNADNVEENFHLANIEIESLEDLKWFPNLKILQLQNIDSLDDISSLESLDSLIDLKIQDCDNLQDISALSELLNLTSLNLEGDYKIESFRAISNLTKLTSLSLCNTGFTRTSILAGLTNLTELNLAKTHISDISVLINLKKLKYLNLNSCEGIGLDWTSDISALGNLTNLTELYLGGTSITDISVLSGLTNLTRLRLSGITDISALSGLMNLTSLDLSHCSGMTDISALSGLVNLTSLDLSYCVGITDISALSGLLNLTTLDLSRCDGITDISPLDDIPNLEILY